MTISLSLESLSLAQLKVKAAELNATVTGDKRLRETWTQAIVLAEKALKAAGQVVDEFTGYPLTKTAASFGGAVVEAYGIAHTQFVIPTEKTIVFLWGAVTSEQAFRLYLNVAVGLMRFCFALVRAGMLTRDWYESVKNETETGELSLYEVTAHHIETAVRWCVSETDYWVWHYDTQYQELVERVKARVLSEVRSFFSLSEWIAFLMLG